MVYQKTLLGSHLQSNSLFSNTPKAKRTVMQKLFSLLIALCLATAPVSLPATTMARMTMPTTLVWSLVSAPTCSQAIPIS